MYAIETVSEEGMSVDARDSIDETPLSWATRLDSFNSAKVLLSHSANTEALCTRGWRPLHYAVSHGFKQHGMVELLLDFGANVDCMSTSAGAEGRRTPLQVACAYSRQNRAEILLRRGANILFGDTYSKTALSCAIQLPGSSRDELIQTLLQAGKALSRSQRLQLLGFWHRDGRDGVVIPTKIKSTASCLTPSTAYAYANAEHIDANILILVYSTSKPLVSSTEGFR